MYRLSETHITYIHQQLNEIRVHLKSINARNFKNASDFASIEKALQCVHHTISFNNRISELFSLEPLDQMKL